MKFTGAITGIGALVEKLGGVLSPMTTQDAENVGKAVVTVMKSEIAAGKSPIAGKGSFPAYKHPDRYPGKRKAHSPVNLNLTGRFMGSLTYSVSNSQNGPITNIGYRDASSVKKEQGHREGANRQPKRPTIPDSGIGEAFSKKIESAFLAIILRAVKRACE